MIHSPTADTPRVEPRQAQDALRNRDAFLVDVRSYDEFAAVHATGAVCVPLADLERRAGELPGDRPVLCICATGHRSQIAAERLRVLGRKNVSDVIGGTRAWERAGLPVQKQRRVIPLERQVRGIAGIMVFGFTLLGLTVSPAFAYGALFVGFMLFLSGVTGFCPMLSLLKILPWNQIAASSEQPACAR